MSYAKYSGLGGGGSGSAGVSSLNSATGAVNIIAGTNVTVTTSGQKITIASSGGASGIASINSDTTSAQTLAVGTAGTDFAIADNGTGTHTFNLPTASASNRGALSSADWATFNGKQAALTLGNLTETGSPNLVVTGGTGAVVGSGVSLALTGASIVEATSSVLTLTGATNAALGTGVSIQVKQAGTSQAGYLSATDWNTFNGKQGAGNYVTALTGDVTATGPGSVSATLATVNTNTGSFGSSTAIPSFTVNGKGLITAAATNAVVAPAGTLTGTTLAANVVSSSLTSVGTITSGTWNGTAIAIANGGTGQTTAAAAFNALNPMTTAGDLITEVSAGVAGRIPIGTAIGQILTTTSLTGAPTWANPGIFVAPTVTKLTSGSGTYSVPSGVTYLHVKMIGGGGGGGGSGTGAGNTGGTGGTTTFGTSLLTAVGGLGGNNGGNHAVPGTGGSGTINAPAFSIVNATGSTGGGGAAYPNAQVAGGIGGTSPFAGSGGSNYNSGGTDAAANSGSGGGGGLANTASTFSGGGGGSGAYIDAIIASPSSGGYNYSIGVSGTAGTAGTSGFAGGAGGSGQIIIEEYYTDGAAAGQGVVTDWAPYTAIFTNLGTVTTQNLIYRQVGGSYEVRGTFVGGSPASSEARMSLPNSAVSLSSLPTISAAGVYFYGSSSSTHGGSVLIEPSVGYVTFSSTGIFSNTSVSALAKAPGNIVGSSGDTNSVSFSVPIAGLSAGTPTPLLPVATRYTGSATSISGTLTTIVFANQDTTTSTTTMTSGVFTCPSGGAGRYQYSAGVQITGTFILNSTIDLQAVKNATVLVEDQDYAGGAQTAMAAGVSDGTYLAVGDTLQIKLASSGTSPVITNSTKTWVSIVKVSQ